MYNRELDLYQGGEAGKSDGWGGKKHGNRQMVERSFMK
jgi:hypothetical protein